MPAPPRPPAALGEQGPDPAALLAWAAGVGACAEVAVAESRRLLRLLPSDGLHGQAGDALADLGRQVAGDLVAVARHSREAADELVAAASRARLP